MKKIRKLTLWELGQGLADVIVNENKWNDADNCFNENIEDQDGKEIIKMACVASFVDENKTRSPVKFLQSFSSCNNLTKQRIIQDINNARVPGGYERYKQYITDAVEYDANRENLIKMFGVKKSYEEDDNIDKNEGGPPDQSIARENRSSVESNGGIPRLSHSIVREIGRSGEDRRNMWNRNAPPVSNTDNFSRFRNSLASKRPTTSFQKPSSNFSTPYFRNSSINPGSTYFQRPPSHQSPISSQNEVPKKKKSSYQNEVPKESPISSQNEVPKESPISSQNEVPKESPISSQNEVPKKKKSSYQNEATYYPQFYYQRPPPSYQSQISSQKEAPKKKTKSSLSTPNFLSDVPLETRPDRSPVLRTKNGKIITPNYAYQPKIITQAVQPLAKPKSRRANTPYLPPEKKSFFSSICPPCPPCPTCNISGGEDAEIRDETCLLI